MIENLDFNLQEQFNFVLTEEIVTSDQCRWIVPLCVLSWLIYMPIQLHRTTSKRLVISATPNTSILEQTEFITYISYTRIKMNWFGKKKSEPSTTTTQSSHGSGSGGNHSGATIVKLRDAIDAQEKRYERTVYDLSS
jgi:hypothetical protein